MLFTHHLEKTQDGAVKHETFMDVLCAN